MTWNQGAFDAAQANYDAAEPPDPIDDEWCLEEIEHDNGEVHHCHRPLRHDGWHGCLSDEELAEDEGD
jgi:hypothetical protein